MSNDALTIGLAQMRCEKGAIDENIARIVAYIERAEARGVDVLCFPEASITGYVDPRRYGNAILSLDGSDVARVVALTNETRCTVIAGLIEANGTERPFITQIVARAGRCIAVYRKQTIPDDEAALFIPGSGGPIVPLPRATFGIAVCADIDAPTVFAEHAQRGASIVFEAAAPGLYGDQATRNWQSGFDWWKSECQTKLSTYARENRIWVAVATQAGRTVDEDFPGGGYVFAPDGACVAATPDWRECVMYATVGPNGARNVAIAYDSSAVES